MRALTFSNRNRGISKIDSIITTCMHYCLLYIYLQLVAPFSAQILMLQLDNLPVDLRPLYSGHTDSILLVGDESGFRDIRVIIPNLVSLTFGIVQSGGKIFTEAPLDNTNHHSC